MMLAEVESAAKQRRPAMYPKTSDEFCVCKGEFLAVVQPDGNRYGYFLRDLRRERPTIHGFGVDFRRAVTTVSQLLDALTREQ